MCKYINEYGNLNLILLTELIRLDRVLDVEIPTNIKISIIFTESGK